MATVILLDSGYFVGRMQKHWSPKGKMRRAHNSFKRKKTNWFQRQYQFQKALNSDLGYIEVVMSRMRVNPKYDKSCSLILCFDGIKGRQLRGALYDGYKANRTFAADGASTHEGKDIREVFTASGLEVNELKPRWTAQYDENKEADDLIAELCMAELLKQNDVVILSGDADLFQMLRYPNVRIHNFKKEITAEDVVEKYGVAPEHFADWKALAGDASDNIPGVHGIGEKKASALLAQYGSLEEIPSEEFRTYSAANIKTLAAKVKRVREDNKWSISKCKKEFGTAWAKIEQGEKVTLNAEQVRKLTRAFDISGYLIFDDYYHRALTWKRIVRLPYGDGQPTI
jgi:5'-3' exonuclease